MLAAGLLLSGHRYLLLDLSAGKALFAGANAFLASFVTWAIARELDPDRVSRAYLAQSLLIPLSLLYGPLAVLPSTIALASSRYLARISGLTWTIWDRLILLFAPLGFMLYYQNPVFGFVGSLIFGVDACLDKRVPHNKVFSFSLALLSILYTGFFSNANLEIPSAGAQLILVAVAFISLVRLFKIRAVKSLTDFNELAIQPARLRVAILIALLLPLISIGLAGVSPDQFALVIIALVASGL